MSKKIDRDAATAFKNKRRFNSSNTKVIIENGEPKMYLFGNLIAKVENGETLINHCGWTTITTRNRLNALVKGRIRKSKDVFIVNEKFEWGNE